MLAELVVRSFRGSLWILRINYLQYEKKNTSKKRKIKLEKNDFDLNDFNFLFTSLKLLSANFEMLMNSSHEKNKIKEIFFLSGKIFLGWDEWKIFFENWIIFTKKRKEISFSKKSHKKVQKTFDVILRKIFSKIFEENSF